MADKFAKKFNFGGEDDFYALPQVTAEDNGKVLKVVDGEWAAAALIPEPVIISFSFRNVTYSAIEGMTWDEFIDSEYNIPVAEGYYEGYRFIKNGVFVNYGTESSSTGIYYDSMADDDVRITDTIINNYGYYG